MAFYFDSAPAAVMAAAAVAYFAPLYLLSQGVLGPSVVQLAAVSDNNIEISIILHSLQRSDLIQKIVK